MNKKYLSWSAVVLGSLAYCVYELAFQEMTAGTLMFAIAAAWFSAAYAAKIHRWFGVLWAGVLALMVSLYLGVQHKDGADQSFCTVDELFDCDKVNSSVYSELFDIPIAFLGSSFYAGVAALAILSLLGRKAYPLAAHLVAVGSAASVLYSVFLAYASFDMGVFCLLCISLYGFNLLLMVVAFGLARESEIGVVKGAFAGGRSTNAFLGTATVMLIGTMAWYTAGANDIPKGDSAADLASLFSSVEGSLSLDGTEPTYGSDAAKYQVVEFADFECSYCGRLFPEIHQLPKDEPDIQLAFKHYPLSGQCNEGLSAERHIHACGAARAADCANRQGKFWDLARLMFKNQKNVDPDGIRFMAQQVGLDVDALMACVDDPMTDEKVRRDVKHGSDAGVHATPSLFLKGLYGSEWVMVTGGPKAVAKLVAAHKAGMALPETPPAPKPHRH
ncbi:MAG: vitamin K epoxide reductase family protein [Myxococcota bacterium]|jgi:protein-disulfide isomerase/uncharacterized membrane protein|nr:vitamin K epoxide reductase family protein [Myxococcota bacterium]